MAELTNGTLERVLAENAGVQAGLRAAAREARLEHARMGRAVPESRGGQVVWLTPAEVFAEYGLDEFGRPNG